MRHAFTVWLGTLALFGALASAVHAAGTTCPTSFTYKFSGDGVTTVIPPTSPAPTATVPFSIAGSFETSNGILFANPVCPSTATASGDDAVMVYIGATGIPTFAAGGFDEIACEEQVTWKLTAIGAVGPAASQSTIFVATATIVASAPVPSATTPALFCALFVGSTFDIKGFFDKPEKTFRAVETHTTACNAGSVPCPTPNVVDVYSDELKLEGESVLTPTD